MCNTVRQMILQLHDEEVRSGLTPTPEQDIFLVIDAGFSFMCLVYVEEEVCICEWMRETPTKKGWWLPMPHAICDSVEDAVQNLKQRF